MTGIIITTADKLACAKRELAMRKNVYPKWVAQNKMSSVTAARELAAMAAIVRDYEDALMEEAVT